MIIFYQFKQYMVKPHNYNDKHNLHNQTVLGNSKTIKIKYWKEKYSIRIYMTELIFEHLVCYRYLI